MKIYKIESFVKFYTVCCQNLKKYKKLKERLIQTEKLKLLIEGLCKTRINARIT